MYSVSTGATRVDWGVEAVTADGAVTSGGAAPARLPARGMATRDAADRLRARRERTCQALLVGVRQVRPDTTRVAIVRDRRTIRDDGEIFVERERFHAARRSEEHRGALDDALFGPESAARLVTTQRLLAARSRCVSR
jgi:hypothetical protein